MKKILFPTDFSIPANNAFSYAVALAKDLGATIDILHVYNSFFIPSLEVERKAFLATKSNEIQAKINDLIKTIPEGIFDE
jgi:nucleotide-binding universal stress UspA family protein